MASASAGSRLPRSTQPRSPPVALVPISSLRSLATATKSFSPAVTSLRISSARDLAAAFCSAVAPGASFTRICRAFTRSGWLYMKRLFSKYSEISFWCVFLNSSTCAGVGAGTLSAYMVGRKRANTSLAWLASFS